MTDFEFTTDWFDTKARQVWDFILPHVNPRKILEVGTFEGASACYLVEKFAHEPDLELHCVDTWAGGTETHPDRDMRAVEDRFHRNIQRAMTSAPHKVDLVVHKGLSDHMLATLLAQGKRNYFDFIYIDGSHQAADVLCDAVLAFRLLKVGGLLAFDDYLWFENLPEGKDPMQCPKPAIDAFVNTNFRKIDILPAPLYQLFINKLSD